MWLHEQRQPRFLYWLLPVSSLYLTFASLLIPQIHKTNIQGTAPHTSSQDPAPFLRVHRRRWDTQKRLVETVQGATVRLEETCSSLSAWMALLSQKNRRTTVSCIGLTHGKLERKEMGGRSQQMPGTVPGRTGCGAVVEGALPVNLSLEGLFLQKPLRVHW